MREIGDIKRILDQAVQDGRLAEKLRRFLSINPKQLIMFVPLLEELGELAQTMEKATPEDAGHWQYVVEIFSGIINGVATGTMSQYLPRTMLHMHESQLSASNYLPPPFKRSLAVAGSIGLIGRAKRIRHQHDLPGQVIHWERRLGKTTGHWGRIMEKYPGLTPVAFNSQIRLADKSLYSQFFGQWPALRHHKLPEQMLFFKAFKKWPLKDQYTFCPLPSWAADHKNQSLWMSDRNWSEQKTELLRLRRIFSDLEIRFATLPELVYLDWSWRIATGVSPMEIGSFRCEHPVNPNACLTYGGVDQYGGEIKVERDPVKWGHQVMPLFILPKEIEVATT